MAFYTSTNKGRVHERLQQIQEEVKHKNAEVGRNASKPDSGPPGQELVKPGTSIEKWHAHALRFLFTSVVFAIHFLYLILLGLKDIYSKPPEKLDRSHFFFPLAIVLVYVSMAAECMFALYLQPKYLLTFGLRPISTLIFLLVYFLWIAYDYEELESTARLRGTKHHTEVFIWLGIDWLSAGVLAIAMIDYQFGRSALLHWSWLWHTTGIKDCVILLSVLAWFFMHFVIRSAVREHYRGVYGTFLASTRLESDHKRPLHNGMALPPDLAMRIARSSTKNPLTVLDFACADGKRGREILDLFGISCTKVRLIGVDIDAGWCNSFYHNCNPKDFCDVDFRESVEEIDFSITRPDIIIGSHVFYDRSCLEGFIKFLRHQQLGVWVVIRGCSPNSPFTLMMNEIAVEGISPQSFHLWNKDLLKNVAKLAGLTNGYNPFTNRWEERVSHASIPSEYQLKIQRGEKNEDFAHVGYPIAVMNQWLDLSRSLVRDFPRMIQQLFSMKLGDSMHDLVDWQFRIGAKRPEFLNLVCEDIVYLFEKNKEGRL